MGVASGVRWLRMPLPFALNHVNLWLLRDNIDSPDGPLQGCTVVDGGIADDPTRAACAQAPCTAAELLLMSFKRLLDVHQATFAMGESIAHLNALWREDRLQRRCEQGVYRFLLTGT